MAYTVELKESELKNVLLEVAENSMDKRLLLDVIERAVDQYLLNGGTVYTLNRRLAKNDIPVKVEEIPASEEADIGHAVESLSSEG